MKNKPLVALISILIVIAIAVMIVCLLPKEYSPIKKDCKCDTLEKNIPVFDSTRIGEVIEGFTYEEYFTKLEEYEQMYNETGDEYWLQLQIAVEKILSK